MSWNNGRVVGMRLEVSDLPRHVTVFVNWACNLRCRECWLYGDSAANNTWLEPVMDQELPLATFCRLIDELVDAGTPPSVSFMGGEPLLYRPLAEAVRYIKERAPRSYVDVSTNGTTLHKDAEELCAAGIDQIYVSLDGSTAEINDAIRGRNTYARIHRGLDGALEARRRHPTTWVSLNFTITALNYRDLPSMVRLASEAGVDELSVNFSMYFSSREGEAAAKDFARVLGRPFEAWKGFMNDAVCDAVSVDALEETIRQAYEVRGGLKLLIAPGRYPVEARARYFSDEWKSLIREKTCPKLYFQSTVLPNGDVLSCTPFADTVVGNLNEESLRAVWHGSRMEGVRDLLSGGLSPICGRCCDLNNDMDLDPALFHAAR